MKKTKALTLLAAAVLVAAWVTSPQTLSNDDLPDHAPDAVAGELVFWAGGCASCHATPVDGRRAKGDNKLLLGGGLELDTPFGLFRAPNISPSVTTGIGSWSMLEFVNAMQRGVAPDGRHYYPSFPYTSYARMSVADVMDLRAYLDTLPIVEQVVPDHSIAFPYSVRRGIGAWKRLNLDASAVIESSDELVERGRYLAEGAGHCGECHTPRGRFGGLLTDRWLSGAPNLDGDGYIPNITPAGKNTADWSQRNIARYLESGFTPDFDTVGGSMVAVQENLSKLPLSDLEAIAAYLKSVPAVARETDSNEET
ncbi:MAG: cytochrome c [Pseudomonadota bacterium]